MSKLAAQICGLLLLASPAMPAADNPARETQAKAAIAAFAGALKAELTAAMQTGGPLRAIELCNERAPEIARQLSTETGMTLSRVSLRNRNPDNAPNAWQAAVLQEFEQRKAGGESPATLTWQEVGDDAGKTEYRFMQAIPTAPLCLACHGEAIAEPVAKKIAELYPHDRATGFREGDLRGAFVVTSEVIP